MATITKADLIDCIYDQVGLNKTEARDLVETFFEEISQSLVNGENVKLSGFGGFILRDKSSRPGRNPKTGEVIPVTARRVVTFRSGKKLKQQMDRSHDEQGSVN